MLSEKYLIDVLQDIKHSIKTGSTSLIDKRIKELSIFVSTADLNVHQIKKLREISGFGVAACKVALKRNNLDIEKSFDYLKRRM